MLECWCDSALGKSQLTLLGSFPLLALKDPKGYF